MSKAFEIDDSGPRYLETVRDLSGARVALLGVPYDGTTSFRPGARFGPDALRAASVGLETWSPHLSRDLEDHVVADLGNLEIGHGAPRPVLDALEAAVTHIVAHDVMPLTLGGEHSITPGAVRAVHARHPDLVVVQLDAHADLRAEYLGDPDNHACAMRRCIDIVGADRLLQVGIRSGTREEFTELRVSGRLIEPEPAALRTALARIASGGRPVYLTIDLDVFDPSSLPGTGTPEPGGVDWRAFEALLDELDTVNLVAADVVELAPRLDPSDCSSVLAARVVREVLLTMCG